MSSKVREMTNALVDQLRHELLMSAQPGTSSAHLQTCLELNRQIEYGLVILQAGNYLLKEDYSSAIEYACRAQKLFPSLQHAQLLLELIAREHPELKRKIEEVQMLSV